MTPTPRRASSFKIPQLQWVIAGLLLLATAINYLDRLALSVISVDIRREFAINEQDYAQVIAVFMFAYAIMYAGSGYIVDRLGTKRGFGVFIGAWSLAQMLHGFVIGKWSLAGARFILGLAEPGNWPAATKAVAEWFPPKQRAIGIGLMNAGSSIGSAVAPPMIAWLTLHYNWRVAFIATGCLGLLWLCAWMLLYDPPEKSRWLRPQDRPDVESVKPAVEHAHPDWTKVLTMRECYTLILTRFFTDPVIYFVIFWLPEYLRKERGFDLKEVGDYAWVPFIFGAIGYMFGGWLSGRLMQSGWTLPRARKFVMAAGAAVMPAAIFAPFVPTAAMAIGATCFVTFGHGLWVANLQTLPADLFRSGEIGTAAGFSGTGGAIGGMLASLGTGWLVAHYSYAPVFLLAGLMHPLSAFLTYLMLPDRYFVKAHAV